MLLTFHWTWKIGIPLSQSMVVILVDKLFHSIGDHTFLVQLTQIGILRRCTYTVRQMLYHHAKFFYIIYYPLVPDE